MSIETKRTSKATISLLEEHILEIQYFDNVTVESKDVHELNSLSLKLVNSSPYAVLVIPGKFTSISRGARALEASTELDGDRVAIAMVADSLSYKLIGNFYLNFNKPVTPTKMFNTREDALKWLKQSMNAVAVDA